MRHQSQLGADEEPQSKHTKAGESGWKRTPAGGRRTQGGGTQLLISPQAWQEWMALLAFNLCVDNRVGEVITYSLLQL